MKSFVLEGFVFTVILKVNGDLKPLASVESKFPLDIKVGDKFRMNNAEFIVMQIDREMDSHEDKAT